MCRSIACKLPGIGCQYGAPTRDVCNCPVDCGAEVCETTSSTTSTPLSCPPVENAICFVNGIVPVRTVVKDCPVMVCPSINILVCNDASCLRDEDCVPTGNTDASRCTFDPRKSLWLCQNFVCQSKTTPTPVTTDQVTADKTTMGPLVGTVFIRKTVTFHRILWNATAETTFLASTNEQLKAYNIGLFIVAIEKVAFSVRARRATDTEVGIRVTVDATNVKAFTPAIQNLQYDDSMGENPDAGAVTVSYSTATPAPSTTSSSSSSAGTVIAAVLGTLALICVIIFVVVWHKKRNETSDVTTNKQLFSNPSYIPANEAVLQEQYPIYHDIGRVDNAYTSVVVEPVAAKATLLYDTPRLAVYEDIPPMNKDQSVKNQEDYFDVTA